MADGTGPPAAACGRPVFTATILAHGAVRDGYRPLRHMVSSLALGPGGWIQRANFAVTGALCLAGAAGLRLTGDRLAGSRAGPITAGGPVSRPVSRSTALPPR
jgi:Protein of unknown function (DUF998)